MAPLWVEVDQVHHMKWTVGLRLLSKKHGGADGALEQIRADAVKHGIDPDYVLPFMLLLLRRDLGGKRA